MELTNDILVSEADEESPYCAKCGACGEEGCCPASRCKGGKACLYPYYHLMSPPKEAEIHGRSNVENPEEVAKRLMDYYNSNEGESV